MPTLPNPSARRRNKSSEFTELEGDNPSDAPEWPGEEPPTDAEWRRWELLWSSPVSMKWNRHDTPLVMRVVRMQLEAEAGVYKRSAELRQLEDRLALNPLARQRHRLKVNNQPVATDGLPAEVIPLNRAQ